MVLQGALHKGKQRKRLCQAGEASGTARLQRSRWTGSPLSSLVGSVNMGVHAYLVLRSSALHSPAATDDAGGRALASMASGAGTGPGCGSADTGRTLIVKCSVTM
jgi:hypothetical protein